MRFLLDTNIISESGKKKPHNKVMTWLLQHEAASFIPSVALAECYEGAHSAPKEKRAVLIERVDDFSAEFADRILSFDPKAAKIWGEYVSRPALKVKPRGYADTMIAAIALANDLILITRNVGDFPEISTLNPFED
jgi:toxin FitB